MRSPKPKELFALIEHEHGAVWLDSGKTELGWSIISWNPSKVSMEAEDWPIKGRALTHSTSGSEHPAPFASGCIGYIGYGAGYAVSPVPCEAATGEPPCWLGYYEGSLCFRHEDNSWHLYGPPSFCDQAKALLEQAKPLPTPEPGIAPKETSSIDRQEYLTKILRILDLISEGDCYQVNLSRPVWVKQAGDPFAAYRRLRQHSNAQYGAYLRLSDRCVILSNSPECFLRIQDNTVTSIPIKGTRPRGQTPDEDAALLQQLQRSPKERAELTMIVDLVRNDLGKVCVPGSIDTHPRRLTTHANVHHASQHVCGQLRLGNDAWSALAATFPPGSVTGAPKIRSCKRISELEEAPRGVYCGAIGFVDDRGSAEFSVAIRTAVYDGDSARFHVGGGIVADSDPADEWLETVHKGKALAKALAGEA